MRKAADLIEGQFIYRNRIWNFGSSQWIRRLLMTLLVLSGTLSTKEGMEEIVLPHGRKEREKRRDEESAIQWDMCLKRLQRNKTSA